jgi:hypothetical protein
MTPKFFFQSGFWNSISSNTTREGIRAMLNVSDALSNSHVVTDATEELIKKDPFLMVMIKQGNYSRCDNNYIDKKLGSLNSSDDTEDLCAIYLLDKRSNECDSIERRFGVVAICSEQLPEKDYLFKGDGFSLDKSRCYGQRYMTFKDKLNQPCNSLIIIDPYLLSKRKKEGDSITFPGIANNLESLLDAILPQTLEVDFHLTIVSNLSNGAEDVKRAYEKVKKCCKRIRKDLVVKIGFAHIDLGYNYKVESFHSRHILSNSFMVDSEDGLDLFDDTGHITKNNPSVSIVFPWLFGDSRQDITKHENWLRSVKKQLFVDSPDCYFYGIKENRLFELVD